MNVTQHKTPNPGGSCCRRGTRLLSCIGQAASVRQWRKLVDKLFPGNPRKYTNFVRGVAQKSLRLRRMAVRTALNETACHPVWVIAALMSRGGMRRKQMAGKARRFQLAPSTVLFITSSNMERTFLVFFAISDRDWILDGANVHISMVGFDGRQEKSRMLDETKVSEINSNLSAASADTTSAIRLPQNLAIAFMGDTKGGPFDIAETVALDMLHAPNPNGFPSSDVVIPWINGLDVTRRHRRMWIVDFGVGLTMGEACQYECPFAFAKKTPGRRAREIADYHSILVAT